MELKNELTLNLIKEDFEETKFNFYGKCAVEKAEIFLSRHKELIEQYYGDI